MKDGLLVRTGKRLMRLGKLRICIVDDQPTYFNDQMVRIARASGFVNIERHYIVDNQLLSDLVATPPDIIILDIKGVTDGEVAKNGWGIAKIMFDKTNAYVVVTSAHQFYLHETHRSYDYLIEQRFLTAVDFVEELTAITERYLHAKVQFWAKPVFRLGFALVKKMLIPHPG